VGYHLAHFREMLGFVERVYGGVLNDATRGWLSDFAALPVEAQSLFVRIANRKGKVFRVDHLRYEDVPDRAAALRALEQGGFVSALYEGDYAAALSVLGRRSHLKIVFRGRRAGSLWCSGGVRRCAMFCFSISGGLKRA